MLRSALRRRRVFLWLVPATALVLIPRQHQTIPHIIASPDIIPPRRIQVFSPSERTLLRDKIWEPVLTAARFVYLLALFTPVIFTSPLVLTKEGAVWWYDLLVSIMQKAGPTFIKVLSFCCLKPFNSISLLNGQLHVPISFRLRCAIDSALYTLMDGPIPSSTQNESSSLHFSSHLSKSLSSLTRSRLELVQ